MPKRRPNTPAFLKQRLDRKTKTMGLVRDQFSGWAKSTENQLGEKPRMSLEILRDFIDHLGFHDGQFRNIAPDAVKTTHQGTAQIYDYLRKHLGKHDERRVPTPVSKTKPKPTPPKIKSAENKEDDQIKDQPPVAVTANEIPGHHEEKDVKFYKNQQSSEGVEPSNSEPSKSNSDSASNSSVQTKYDGENHKRAKLMFNTIMDAHVEQPFKHVTLMWHQDSDMTFNI